MNSPTLLPLLLLLLLIFCAFLNIIASVAFANVLLIVNNVTLSFDDIQANFEFRAFCVDSWLISWRTFCHVCKRDARTNTGEPQSESTPLLSSNPGCSASSVRSSLASSSAIHIAPSPSRSPTSSISQSNSLSATPYVQHSLQS